MSRVEHLAEGVTLFLGDCREIMSGIEDNSIDMIWTDPPYGHSNHDGDFNARLNDHRGLENKPIECDSPEARDRFQPPYWWSSTIRAAA